MNVGALATLLRERARLRARDRWTRDEVLAFQARRLAELRAFAVARSPFYRDLHRGLGDAPLSALPVVTKATLMERFDDVVTDPEVRLTAVERYLDTAAATDRFQGRYRVAATGGTTGRRGVFLADPREWTQVLASYGRAYEWAGILAGLRNRIRMAVISSRNPSHQSAIVGATVASRWIPTLRLDAGQPIEEVVAALNAFRPDVLVGYASMLHALASEQMAGRLRIAPRAAMSASEVLTDEARARINAAFGIAATNVYAATEAAGIASECRMAHLHRYDDLVVTEIVDEDYQPVRDGEFGARLLVSVLFSRTQPLIRYELSDRVMALSTACPDGLPFSLLGGIEGRQEDVLSLDGHVVRPNTFHNALERVAVGAWQVVEDAGRLSILLAQPLGPVEPADVRARVAAALERAGVRDPAIDVSFVDEIPRTALGKAPLVRRVTGIDQTTA